MSGFAEHLAEHRRLATLRFLAEAPGYTGNDSLLASALATVGLGSTRDQVRTDLAWLAEQGLVTVVAAEPLTVVRITERGTDAAAGRARVPGVAKPSPRG